MRFLQLIWREDTAQSLTEYALLAVLVSLVAVASMKVVGISINDVFEHVAHVFNNAIS